MRVKAAKGSLVGVGRIDGNTTHTHLAEGPVVASSVPWKHVKCMWMYLIIKRHKREGSLRVTSVLFHHVLVCGFNPCNCWSLRVIIPNNDKMTSIWNINRCCDVFFPCAINDVKFPAKKRALVSVLTLLLRHCGSTNFTTHDTLEQQARWMYFLPNIHWVQERNGIEYSNILKFKVSKSMFNVFGSVISPLGRPLTHQSQSNYRLLPYWHLQLPSRIREMMGNRWHHRQK